MSIHFWNLNNFIAPSRSLDQWTKTKAALGWGGQLGAKEPLIGQDGGIEVADEFRVEVTGCDPRELQVYVGVPPGHGPG